MTHYTESDPGEFENAPGGSHSGVCVDFEYLGEQDWGDYGPACYLRYTFLIDKKMEKDPDKHYSVSKLVTDHISTGSNNYKFLRQWFGNPFEQMLEQVERDGRMVTRFSGDKVVGSPALLNLVEGKKYTNIESIGPLPDGMEPMTVPDYYERQQDRPGYKQPEAPVPTDADDPEGIPDPDPDEDLPF
jgi:hypothetical protein